MGSILRTMNKLLTHTDLPISPIRGVCSKLFMISQPTVRDKQAATMALYNTHGTLQGHSVEMMASGQVQFQDSSCVMCGG